MSEPNQGKMTDEEYAKWKEEQAKKLSEKTGGMVELHFHSAEEPKSEKLENVENPEEITKEDVEVTKEVIDAGFEKLQEKHPEIPESYRPKTYKKLMELKTMFEKPKENIPSGTIPLTPQQAYGLEPQSNTEDLVNFEGSVLDLSFTNQAQMIEVLKKRAEKGDERSEESQKILQELFNKMDIKERGEEWTYEGGVQDLQKGKKKWRKVK